MGNRLSKIYTRTGDDGTTGLGDGMRLAKDDIRIETFGTVDEANSVIGMVLAVKNIPDDIRACLIEVQHEMFDVGGELCMPGYIAIHQKHIDRLEHALDEFNDNLPPLKEFILPGGGTATAACHLARTVVRRAERHAWTLAKRDTVRAEITMYLNRLSDLLFVIARILARHEGGSEVLWRHDR